MASYRLEWHRSTKKDLRNIPQRDIVRIVEAAESLADNPYPSNCKKLVNSERAYRIRVGDYRIIYEVHSGRLVIVIIRVAQRGDVYKH